MVPFSKLWQVPWSLLRGGFDDLRNPPEGNQPALDVLRSLAILLVLLYHILPFAPRAERIQRMPFARFGWTGVDLFFVLSGLLIGGQLWRELKQSGGIDVGRFILRRGFRIWPLYYLVVCYLLAQQLFFGRPGHGLWLDASFLSNYYFLFPVGGHEVSGGWSLSLEEQFYLVVPILLAFLARMMRAKWLVHLALAWLIALPLIRYVTTFKLRDTDAIHDAIYYPFQTHSDGLAVGLLLAWILVWKPDVLRIGWWLDAVLALACLGGFLLWYVVSPIFLFSVVALAYGTLTLLLLRLNRKFEFKPKVFYVTSRLSYGVYLLHPGVVHHMMPYHEHLFGDGSRAYVAAFLCGGGVSLTLAFLTFSLVELPFLKLRDRVIKRRSVPERSLAGRENPRALAT
jgi:peptidoglycan/LPS O-acetylase OafA/YrhL